MHLIPRDWATTVCFRNVTSFHFVLDFPTKRPLGPSIQMRRASRAALTPLRTGAPPPNATAAASHNNSRANSRASSPANSARRATGGTPRVSSARGGNSSARGGNKRAPTPPAAAPATAKDKAKGTKSKEKRPRASSVGRRASNKSGSAAAAKLEPSTAVGAATILQRRWRAVLAQRKAREELHLLRQFNLLMAEVRLECLQQRAARLAAEARAESALKLQCATRRRLARRALHGAAATRLQCAARQKLARKAAHDAYWSYAFGLLNEDGAERLQRWWRAVLARRRAQVDLALLRDWDALQVGVRAACEARAAAARRLQRAARSHSVAQWLGAMCRGADRDAAPSGFSVREADSNPRPLALLEPGSLCPLSLQSAEGRTFESRPGRRRDWGTRTIPFPTTSLACTSIGGAWRRRTAARRRAVPSGCARTARSRSELWHTLCRDSWRRCSTPCVRAPPAPWTPPCSPPMDPPCPPSCPLLPSLPSLLSPLCPHRGYMQPAACYIICTTARCC